MVPPAAPTHMRQAMVDSSTFPMAVFGESNVPADGSYFAVLSEAGHNHSPQTPFRPTIRGRLSTAGSGVTDGHHITNGACVKICEEARLRRVEDGSQPASGIQRAAAIIIWIETLGGSQRFNVPDDFPY